MPDIKQILIIVIVGGLAVWIIQQVISSAAAQSEVAGIGPHNPEIPHGSHKIIGFVSGGNGDY